MPANQYMQPFFDSLSQGVQVAQSLRQAAMQQQQLQQAKDEFQQRQQLAEQEFASKQQSDLASQLSTGAHVVDANGNVNVASPAPQSSVGSVPLPSSSPDGLPINAPTLLQNLNSSTGATANVAADPNRGTVSIAGRTVQPVTPAEQTENAVSRQQAIEQGTEPTAGQLFGNELAPGADPNVRVPNASTVLAGRAYAQGMRGAPQAAPVRLENKGFTDKGEPVNFNPITGETTKGQPIPGMASQNAGGAGKQLTPDAALTDRRGTLKAYEGFLGQESDLNQERRRLGVALQSGNHYLDDKGNLKSFTDSNSTPLPPDQVASLQADMRQRFAAVTDQLNNVVNQKYDAMGRLGSVAQVPRQQALAAIDAGTKQVLAPAAPKSNKPAAPPAAPAPQPQQNTIAVGQTATNAKTKARVRWNGTAWLPIQ